MLNGFNKNNKKNLTNKSIFLELHYLIRDKHFNKY